MLHQIGFPQEDYIDFMVPLELVELFAPVLKFDGAYKGLPMSAEVFFKSTILYPAVDESRRTIW